MNQWPPVGFWAWENSIVASGVPSRVLLGGGGRSAVEGLLERAIDGHGAVVAVAGPPGIGKSRLVREVSAIADARDVEVFTAFCESHTSQVPFHAVARLPRGAFGVEGLYGQAARAVDHPRLATLCVRAAICWMPGRIEEAATGARVPYPMVV